MNIYVLKDKDGNEIKQGERFTFEFIEDPAKPPLDFIGSFSWNQDELRYEIDIHNHKSYTCLYYNPLNMCDFHILPTPKEFIIERLKALHDKFDNIHIRYEIEPCGDTHIIEIMPLNLYKDKKFMDEEIELIYDFSCRYKGQDILFISEESLTEIKKPIFEI